MSMEAEVFPLMLLGVVAVTVAEVLCGKRMLAQRPRAFSRLMAHAATMLVAFFFLFRSAFPTRMEVESVIPSVSASAGMGLFGLFWAASVACLISLVMELLKDR
ncbi:hypothetical protein [uncultured Oscillibacter sp.]|uniref:hypothetical protein n=1 Tax=uncultured Oscillibacter sp. TaxID=876091 RepID=UPI0025FF529B|nr:hypothetical protein [uncultured Oscillibacter sp.]